VPEEHDQQGDLGEAGPVSYIEEDTREKPNSSSNHCFQIRWRKLFSAEAANTTRGTDHKF